MSDCSPLKLAENGHSSPSQSLDSQGSGSPHHHQTSRVRSRSSKQRTTNGGDDPSFDHQAPRIRSNSESSSKSSQIRYEAKNVIELFIPVSICMLIVVTIMKLTDSYHYSSQSVIWYAQMMYTDQTVDTGTRIWQSFANALIMLVMIVIMTTVLILLYKFRCYTAIHGWLIVSSLMLLFLFATVHITELLKVYNVAMDIYTMGIFLWNFGVVGMVCIHWKGPLFVQQSYLILISAFMALIFIQCLPDWTIWTVLAIVSVWDLVAVLAPGGPLRILVETAQERNESIFPALIYSSTMMWEVLGTTVASTVPTISMADAATRRQESSRLNKQSRQAQSGSKSQSVSLASTSGASVKRGNKHSTIVPNSPKKREQHPVEIHYDDGAQPPEVAFIQPTLNTSSNSDDWQRAPVRATDTTSNRRHRSTRPSRTGEEHNEMEPDEQAINMPANNNHENHHHHRRSSRQLEQVEEERGVKLGLGDFIFYSVLVGKVSSLGDWTVTVSCYIAILVGLSVTLSLLAIFRKALPALPISIAFGMCSFFLSSVFVVPFAEELAINQVFI